MADKILIVDDEPEIADLVSLYLQNENFIVFKFYNAADALKCVQSETLDLAILDVMLPDMNGFQLCQKIREKYQYPVIMLTAKGEEIDKITGLTLGADDYIIVPFFSNDLGTSTELQTNSANSHSETGESESENNVFSEINVDLEHLYSPYAILVELDSGNVLAEHNSEDKIYPASLTKIMTAVLAIENTDDLSQTVTLPYDIFEPLYEENASMAGFQPGEEATLKDLLYGILLPSGAECCMAFADRIAGSEEAFVDMMNEKAAEIGMSNTHFCNATGLHNPDHYSTVKDISVLLKYALQYEDFRQAFSSSRYSTRPTNQHPDGFTFRSTMFKYMESTEVVGGEIIGGKTGYTEEAGLCLASLAEVDGKEYILVTAKANGTHQTEQFHILDAINVYSQIGELNITD